MKKTMVFTISVFSLGLWRGFRGKRETEVNSYEIAMKPIAVVFARDRYKCARCGDDRGGNLEAHHIRPFYKIMEKNYISDYEAAMACKELWDVDNGIAICEKCHIEISAALHGN